MARTDYYMGVTLLCAVVGVHGMDSGWATATRVLATLGAFGLTVQAASAVRTGRR